MDALLLQIFLLASPGAAFFKKCVAADIQHPALLAILHCHVHHCCWLFGIAVAMCSKLRSRLPLCPENATSFAFASNSMDSSSFGNLGRISLSSSNVAVNCSSGSRLCRRCADMMIFGVLLMMTSMAVHRFCCCCYVFLQDSWCTHRLPAFGEALKKT